MLALLILLACGGPYGAPIGSDVSLTLETIKIPYDDVGLQEDGQGWLMETTALVTGPASSGELVPLNNIEVTVASDWLGAYIVDPHAIRQVSEYEEACSEGSADEEDCAGWFDYSDANAPRYYEITGTYDYADDFRPTYMTAPTDGRGTLSFFVFFDSVPYGSDAFYITASIQVDVAQIEVQMDAVPQDAADSGGQDTGA